LLAFGAAPHEAALTDELAFAVLEVDLGDIDLEDEFDGVLDLCAVGVWVHVERVLTEAHLANGLLAEHGRQDDVVRVHACSSRSNRPASAMTRSARRMSYTFRPAPASTSTQGRLRAARRQSSSSVT